MRWMLKFFILSGLPTNLKIKKGLQKICVESPGGHELQLSDSCISFGSNSIKIDVSNPQPIHLRAEKYLVKGLINVESSSTEIESELPENFIVDIQDKEGSVINSISAKLASDGSGVYEYYTWANLGEKISFVPRDSRSNVGKKMLFYPKELRAVVSNDGCQAAVSPFTGRLGLYIQGSVSPPLPGVNIKVSAAKDSLISSLKKGEVAVETSTSPDGSFVAGPLYDDIPYDTDASKKTKRRKLQRELHSRHSLMGKCSTTALIRVESMGRRWRRTVQIPVWCAK
ncbi:PREDICTED: nodal modulator 3-like isoform X2 [Brassica oleracea var. oleracea]|nr:PREDICTED: nodal modulator 3-like isoform X2 [Brassica oleracea var. oleracea]